MPEWAVLKARGGESGLRSGVAGGEWGLSELSEVGGPGRGGVRADGLVIRVWLVSEVMGRHDEVEGENWGFWERKMRRERRKKRIKGD